MVTRAFVFLLPFILLGPAYAMCRRRWTNALLAAAAFYLFLADYTPMLIVGRPDVTALAGLAVAVALANALLRAPSGARRMAKQRNLEIAFGAVSALSFLTLSRVGPALALLLALVSVRRLASQGWRPLLAAGARYGLGFALVFVAVFFFELHGDGRLFYRRFYGIFTSESGWGSKTGPAFRLFWPEIAKGRELAIAALIVATLAAIHRARRRFWEMACWGVGLPALWVVLAYGFYKNEYAGGTWYFCPFFMVLWFFLVRSLLRRASSRAMQLGALTMLLFVPWRGVEHRRREVADMQQGARDFLDRVAAYVGTTPIVSENLQLYKKQFSGEIVDVGDTVSVIANSGFYGSDFTATFRRYEDWMAASPPRFVLAGCFGQATWSSTVSPEFRRVLDSEYTIVLRGPHTMIAWGDGYPALFERKSP